ncbi:MAG: dipicolinate synthase subunit DpsA [Clostridia bacterium]
MIKFSKIAVIGGDLRHSYLAKELSEENFEVFAYGICDINIKNNNIVLCKNIHEAIESAEIIILPLPFSTDNINLNAISLKVHLPLIEIYSLLNKNQILIGGNFNKDIYDFSNKHGFKIFDYFKREELVIQNIIPTAEGALQIAMQETAFTIHNSNCVVLGFGRISKLLSKYLKSLGSNVFVFARKYSDLAWIDTYGYTPCNYSSMLDILPKANIIFNTVPSLLIDEKALKVIKDDTVIIDLASRPGGIDFACAASFSKKVIWALSLPGKVAPFTSGKIIKNTIINILNEEEKNV